MGMKCEKCESEFGDSKALEQHAKAKHSTETVVSPKILQRMQEKEDRNAEKAAEMKAARTGKFLKYGILLVAVLAIGYGVVNFTSSGGTVPLSSSALANPSQPTAAIPSGPIHWHPVLTIKINGQQQIIPENIGIGSSIHQPIHTHDTSGTLHMENDRPTADNMKLGFFFQIWNKKFNSQCIFDNCNTADKKVRFTVNGKENMDFENYIMADGDKMVIEY